MIKAILLAAGEGRRLGYEKMSRPILGKPIIFWTLDLIRASGFDPKDIVVVIGYDGDKLKKELSKYGVRLNIVENPDFRKEMFSSIKTGILSLSKDIENVLIVLGDQPLVKPATIKAILSERHPLKVVQPVFNGKRSHPILIPKPIVETIHSASFDHTLKDLMPPPEERILVPVDDEGVCIDIDTFEDLKLAESILKIRHQEADADP
ncbi:nucleotidyltransferase family protein [Acetomicrobium hydrogeniformans]|uniref:MobA-like NTP transferase domain-containing protein n=1 Tax=Acetomicrobium hydrogeniformans ATCC BAA-1850 TaxID=592015 RepID=A0A0T5X9J9_9BACT|nr:nucleotidyltransferase family protein [Acetomicrobium hydrogeniformans]KRT34946.1 hypothetical protein HMPREF1705_04200 [Acetomicrobium hydrogeniformans ATCC BAA-1850]